MSKILRKLLKGIANPSKAYRSLKHRYLRKYGSPRKFAGFLYYQAFGKKINWEHPEDLNQWINWLAFNTDTTEWSRLADKYAVRDYIKEKGFEENLVPLLAVWDKPEDITFDSLPDRFVLKINNGSGDVKIITDKRKVNLEEIRAYFRKLFDHPFGIDTAEPHYRRMIPKVIAEELLDINSQEADSCSLIDYKFLTINQRAEYCLVISDRKNGKYATGIYHLPDWKLIPEYTPHEDNHIERKTPVPKPKTLDKMMEMASTLTEGFPFVRMDFYEVGGKAYFGEMTFTPACGRMTSLSDSLQKKLGQKLTDAYKDID